MKFVKIEFTPDRMGPRRSADLLPAASGQVATRPHSVDISSRADSILAVVYGAFVYRLGHGPLKAERRVRFPYALPLKLRHLRKSAGRSSRFRKIFRSVSPTDFFWRGIPRQKKSVGETLRKILRKRLDLPALLRKCLSFNGSAYGNRTRLSA